jgi:hypothetical protein
MRKTVMRMGVAGAILVLAVALVGCGGDDDSTPSGEQANRQADEDPIARHLAALRSATSRFMKPDAALAAGYVADPICVASPMGGMGVHYLKPPIMDTRVVVEEPEILLYAPDSTGTMTLVGVEYFVPDADQNLTTSADKPSLFGKPFDGPMDGHAPGMPIHYDLHVWLYKDNPAGMFAQWNPQVTCPAQ